MLKGAHSEFCVCMYSFNVRTRCGRYYSYIGSWKRETEIKEAAVQSTHEFLAVNNVLPFNT